MYPINNSYFITALSTPQSKEVQIDNTGGDNSSNNNITVTTTPIQTVKTLKIYKLDLYYGNQNKLKG